MTRPNPWRPSRRRLTDTLRAALAPVAAWILALAGLTAWVGAGEAGSPARITVSSARVFLTYGASTETAAFFDLRNRGGADDRLVGVTSPATRGGTELSRHRVSASGAGYKGEVPSVTVPAGGRLTMSPHGVDVTLRAGDGWRVGDRVPFTLHFERGAPVRTFASVVRPGEPPAPRGDSSSDVG
ncbi:copper chaperone PCu(A)C [Streptomyces sp. NPDC048664]|uniref:copper chaperone PCu(A)C n=1 Tax=Streptomyces sp. NPDC048664 TaxID=3154505 RepID=UPI0034331FB1